MSTRGQIILLGIDPSTKKLAVVALHQGRFLMDVLHLVDKPTDRCTPESVARAYHAMQDHMIRLFRLEASGTGKVSRAGRVAFLEAPVVGRGGVRTAIVQAYTSGPVQAVLVRWGFSVHLIDNHKWKKELTGNGNATKVQIAVALSKQWPQAYAAAQGDQDLVDAAGIAYYGERIVKRATTVRRPGSLVR